MPHTPHRHVLPLIPALAGALAKASAGATERLPCARVTNLSRALDALVSIPSKMFGLILVAAFGVGPFAGVITLAISTLGGLGKLFAEINEQAD